MINNNIKDTLSSFRKRRGLDRRDIAAAAGVDYLTVTKWEIGYALPTDDELIKIAEHFSVSPEMFGVEKAPVSEPIVQNVEEAPAPKITERIELRIDTNVKTSLKAEIISDSIVSVKPEPKAESISAPIIAPAAQLTEPIAAPVSEPTAPVSEPTAPVSEPIAPVTAHVLEPVNNVPFSEYEKAYAEKKARYEKYVKTASYKNAGVKIRRMLAYCFDIGFVFVLALIGLIGLAVVSAGAQTLSAYLTVSAIGGGTLAVVCALIFVFRDFIFGGRSLGKRVFCLYIVDADTAKKAAVYQRVLRAIITLSPIIDVLFLIVRGKTVGDSVASTLVVGRHSYRFQANPPVSPDGVACYDVPEKRRKNHTLLTLIFIFAVIAAIVISVAGFAFAYGEYLEEEKHTDRYEVAYTYLTTSDRFLKSKADESELKLLVCYLEYSYDTDELVSSYYFCTDKDSYTVVLHLGANSEWEVCDICTEFY